MAKRFTDTEKWKKHFIRGLDAPYKLLWIYILDECSAAGLWDVDIEVAQIKLGVKLKKDVAINSFDGRITVLDKGTKWFIPSFIEFQYGNLSSNNKAHTQTIIILNKYGLLYEDLKLKPLECSLQGDKDMVMGKLTEMVEVKETVKEKPQNLIVLLPFNSESFIALWENWKDYKSKQHKFKYASAQTEQAALTELTNISQGDEQKANAVIMQSMANGWKGFFDLKSTGNGNSNTNTKQAAADRYSDMARRLEDELKPVVNKG